jgi:hypothetical protein
MILTPDNPAPSLTLSNGETVPPRNGSGDGSLGTMGIVAAIVLLTIMAAVWKRRKIALSMSQSKIPRGDHCTRCGWTFQIEDRYCPNCGASLDDQ